MAKKIGRVEKVSFPKLNEGIISAKIDTGAFSAALHVDSVKQEEFGLKVKIGNNTYVFNNWTELEVKSSNGEIQKRFGVKLKMRMGDENYNIFVTLTDRKSMKFVLLIGRKFLHNNNFIVDVRNKNIHGRPKKI